MEQMLCGYCGQRYASVTLPENVQPNLACEHCAAKVLVKEWGRHLIKHHTPPQGHPPI